LARKYDLYSHLKLNTEVKSLVWDEDIQKWRVRFIDLNAGKSPKEQELLFDIIINGPGILRDAKIPQEYLTFKGPVIHSAEWDHSVELENKNVAIVGTGVTTLQLVPALVDKVKQLHVYQRNPPWILPLDNYKFSTFSRFLYTYVPLLFWLYRVLVFFTFEKLANAFIPGSSTSQQFVKQAKDNLAAIVPKEMEKLREDMTPKYTFGCKRIGFSSKYLQAMVKSQVKLHTSPIVETMSDGIVTKDGNKEKFDVLVLATGYKVQDFFSPLQITGRKGENILKTWVTTTPRNYMGIVSNSMPNHFMLLGPYSILGHNSVVFMIECQVNFTMKVIKEMMRRKKQTVTVKRNVEEIFMNEMKINLDQRVWSSDCSAWYKNSRGEVTTIWPHNCVKYWWNTKRIDFSNFEFV